MSGRDACSTHHAERLEERPGDGGRADVARGPVLDGHRPPGALEMNTGHTLEEAALPANDVDLGHSERPQTELARAELSPGDDQPILLLYRQRTQQYAAAPPTNGAARLCVLAGWQVMAGNPGPELRPWRAGTKSLLFAKSLQWVCHSRA
jgi:hypothetical protein